MLGTQPEFDHEKAQRFAARTGQQLAAAINCYLSYIGDDLGLYKTILDLGWTTSDELAEATGLHERWIREWLRHQACNQHLDYDVDKDAFSINPEVGSVLCDEDSPYYFASGFQAFAALRSSVDRLPEAFVTGLGMRFDEHGPGCACGIEKLNNYIPRFELVQSILPQLDGVCERLEKGAKVADVGCGAGIALLNMAKAFPKSEFTGVEISTHAIERARSNIEEWGLSNVSIQDAREQPLPNSHSFDFITTFDVVHDTPFPDRLIAEIYAALRPDGTWLCSDIRSFPNFAKNLAENPSAPLMYGFSVMVCMSSAMSEPGGAGLGTLGFNSEVAQDMTAAAGFTRFRKLEYENAINSYYEIRP
ncbi:MAG: class I SAM-dependent methyltransferase [Gammaproteobacteria bacterium]|nr:class I SAM-dependent methyltransferase [Gammaproteobacteria bacterium]